MDTIIEAPKSLGEPKGALSMLSRLPLAVRVGALAILAGSLTFLLVSVLGQALESPITEVGANGSPTGMESPSTLTLTVTTEPPNANVFVSGRAVGTAPRRLAVPVSAESVFIRVSAPGYRSQSRRVASSAGEARFVLQPAPDGP